MKNFTKQNFKTNPLWTRLLIMAFMLLAGAGNAWAVDYWVVGPAVGGWNQWKKMNQESTTRYTFTVNTGEFKITKANNWEDANRLDNIGCNDNNDTYKENVTCNGANNHSANVAGTLCFNPNDSYMWIESSGTPSTELTRIVAGTPASVFGTEWDPSNQENKMTKTGDGIYTIDYYTKFQSNTTIKFKVTDGSWSNAWPSDDKSHTISEGCQKTTVTYKTNGNTVDVSTVPSNHCCSAPTSVSITRSDAPSTANICQGSTIDLTANVDGSGDITYSWTKVSGTDWSVSANSKKQTCTVTAGTGNAEFKVTATRCGTDITKTITLTADTKPTLTLKSNPTICQGDQITLSEYVSKSSGTVKWYSNSSRTTETEIQNLLVTPSPATTTYYARETNGVCSAVDKNLTVTVRATPTKFDVTVGSADNKVKLSNSQTNYTYTLYNEKGEKVGNSITGSTGTALQWTVSVAGTYTVKAKYKDSTCDETEMNGSYTYSPCTPANVQITSGPSNICPGGSTTFIYTAAAGANITWKMESASNAFAFSENNGTVTVRHSNPSTIVDGANKILYTVTDANNICPASNVDTEKTITLLSVPSISATTSTTQNICYGTTATLTVTNNQGTYTWVSSNGGEAIALKTNSVTVSKAGTYTVTAQNAGGCTSNKITFTVTVKDQVAAPALNPKSATVCGGESFKLQNIDGVTWSLDGKPTTGSQPGIANNTDAAIIKTFQAVKEVDGCLSAPADYKVTVNPTPVITGERVAQPGKANAINLKLQGDLVADWSVNPTADLSYTTNSNSTNFSAETNGIYTITATTKEDCSATHEVTVADAFYIWVRNAKESDTAYGQFYFPNENSEAVRGGAMFYAECDALPTKDNYTTYNRGGRKADIVNDDCDGYTWYGFKASADVIAGTKYFYVHATNDLSDGGYYTHSKPLKSALSSDVYYTLGTTGDSFRGWNLSTADAPYAGPKVHASGSTALGTNKFAALYVTDCSGKKVSSYQWEYCRTQAGTYDNYKASVSNSGTLYTGDAGETNNIRPETLGYYRCKVTYEDGTTATSATEQVTGAYSHPSSNLPVFIVNTNGEGFPVNDCSGTPSKNADKMKEKVSVDVKIYDKEGTMVYDRKARMNYRGSSSLNFLKKSYAFCPGKDNCVEDKGRQDYVKTEKMNMLNVGTAKDKDWVLYAAAPDPSLMRNRLVFDTFRDMTGKWSVNSCYVQLYVDGTYKGVYVLMDKITNNENRVNITHEDGFIVKFDKTDKVDRVGGYEGKLGDEKTFKTTRTGKDDIGTYDTSIDQRFEIEYPEKDDYPTGWSAKVNQIQGMFEAFENALAQGDFATVQKYIDYDSWADWFIISEYVKNVDTYRASNIFVYNGNKIEARPLWDQELSFNNQTNVAHKSNDATGLMATTASIYNNGAGDFPAPFWFTGGGANITGGLLSDPCFVQVVKEKWNKYSTGTGALTQDALNAKIDAYTTELGTAADISFNRGTMDCGSCQDGGCYNGGTGYNNSISKSTSIDAMDTWIECRGNNLTTALNNLEGASFSIQIIPSEAKTTPWEPVEIAVSVTPAGYDYKLEYTGDNNLGGVANTIIKEEGDKITYRIPRPSDWGVGDAEEGARADIEYGIKATLSVQEGTTVCGSQAAPSSTGKIILQDEDNDNCK